MDELTREIENCEDNLDGIRQQASNEATISRENAESMIANLDRMRNSITNKLKDQALFEQGEGSFDKELEKAKQAIDNLNSSPLSISEGDNEDDEDAEVVLNTGAYTTKSGRHSIVPDRFSDKR